MTDDKPSAKNLENVGFYKVYTCPICGEGHEAKYTYKDTSMLLCPKAKEDEIRGYSIPEDFYKDPGFCGLDPLTTGKRDPYWPRCKAHDVHYEKLKAASPDKSNMQVQAEFAKGVLSTAASGLYAFLTAPIYLVIGCIGGMARWTQLEYRNMKARGEKPPKNYPED